MTLWIILGVLALLLAACAVRAALVKPVESAAVSDGRQVDEHAIAKRLSGAIQIKTVTPLDPADTDFAAFDALRTYLEQSYPKSHAAMTRETVDGYAYIYKWPGKDTGKLPALYMAHQDVVPSGDESLWKYAPFSGAIEEGYVWGRGALDMKCQLISLFEAAETLIGESFVPGRDIYFAFGYNEEAAKETGAREIARLFEERGMRFEYVIDEGGTIADGAQFGVNKTLALIGICEKGYADLKITSKGEAGHSSMPPEATALVNLSEAVLKLSRWPMKARYAGPFKEMIRSLTPHMSFPYRFLFANDWLFAPLLMGAFAKKPTLNALTRTTFAPTMCSASEVPNVLPREATANINCRLAPWDSLEDAKSHVMRVVGPLAQISSAEGGEASGQAPVGEAYTLVAQTLSQALPGVVAAPYLMIGATDSRFMATVSDNVLRVLPVLSLKEDQSTMHAQNERIAVDSLAGSVRFFIFMMERS